MIKKLAAMLNELPKNSKNVFNASTDSMRKSYQKQCMHLAFKLKNPRLMQISFYTFRYLEGNNGVSSTRDILPVMQILGHRNIRNTLMDTQLVDFKQEDYIARIAHSEG